MKNSRPQSAVVNTTSPVAVRRNGASVNTAWLLEVE